MMLIVNRPERILLCAADDQSSNDMSHSHEIVVSAIDPRYGDLTALVRYRARPGSQRALVTGRQVQASLAAREMSQCSIFVATEQTAE